MIQEHQLLLNESISPPDGSRVITLPQITPIGPIERDGSVEVSLSLDGLTYETVDRDAQGRTALYVRLTGEGAARVYVGAGYVALPCPFWSDAFKQYEGWTGADGIYSMNLNGGIDSFGHADTRTLFFFSDTFVSTVDRDTLERKGNVYMPNNTYALLDGSDPHAPGALRFFYQTDADGKASAVIKPSRDSYDFEGTGEDFEKAYFWLQDGVVLGDKLYFMPMLITHDPAGREGFQFRGLGVCIAVADIVDGVPDIANARQIATGLNYRADGMYILYGAGMMPYLKEAGFLEGDGYVYVYGHMNAPGVMRSLCAARVLPEDFADWTKWRFFDGEKFTDDIRKSAPLLPHVSCELSVTPVETGRNAGKFLAVFQYDTNAHYLAYAVGESPVGPFGDVRKVYYTGGDLAVPSAYMYNAKAHPHLSQPGRLLASYNVNCTSWAEALMNGHVYRPRFVELVDTTV